MGDAVLLQSILLGLIAVLQHYFRINAARGGADRHDAGGEGPVAEQAAGVYFWGRFALPTCVAKSSLMYHRCLITKKFMKQLPMVFRACVLSRRHGADKLRGRHQCHACLEQPGAAEPVRQIKVSEAGLPLAIQSKQPGFYQVVIGGKNYWLRGARVRISRDTTANCGTVALASSQQTAATPGAGKDACI
jgi:hypothetical protein